LSCWNSVLFQLHERIAHDFTPVNCLSVDRRNISETLISERRGVTNSLKDTGQFLTGLNTAGECHSGSVSRLRRAEGRPLTGGGHIVQQGCLLLSGVAQRLELDFRLLNRVETVKTLFQGGTESGSTGSASGDSADLNGLL